MSQELPFFDYASAPSAIQAAYDLEVATRGYVTNMKRVLLHSLAAHNAYLTWFDLAAELAPQLGSRKIWLFCLAICQAYPSTLCALYFQRSLTDAGFRPDTYQPDAAETLLMDFGRALATHSTTIDPTLWQHLKSDYDITLLTNLTALGGLMVAQIIFANAVAIDIDPRLLPYLQATD
jgi:hypothetical protein